jgi:ATP-dependent Lon protease
LCEENRKDVDDINAEYLKGLHIHFVTQMHEVLDIALLKERAKSSILQEA